MSDPYGATRHTVTYTLGGSERILDVILTPGYTTDDDIPAIIRMRYLPLGTPERDVMASLRILSVSDGVPL